ncbi:M48 family metalloprotease [Streptomyces sp. NBRC 110028]|uniref:M48 family metalloprotease n=1 Tax=Streptomyces sp. NBRC 110028 TaxID=1621260 RepID=UPI0006E1F208|nr:M48 family metalloprotease [Streptomyces sp. NBRC 110028]
MDARKRHVQFLFPSGTSAAFILLVLIMLAVPATWSPPPFDALAHSLHPSNDSWGGSLLAVSSLCLLTVTQYWLAPSWKIRRRRLRPIHQVAPHEPRADLERLVEITMPDFPVRILIDLVNPAIDGLAFGHVFRRYVVLSRGVLLALSERDRETAWRVVMHELAHIRNRDLDITAITVAMWRSFLVVVVAPVLAACAIGIVRGTPPIGTPGLSPDSGPGLSWMLAAQIVGLTALAWLARSVVLQARELHADARVLTWHPDPQPLRHPFYSASQRRWPSTILRRATHPSPAARVAALSESGRLLLRQGFAYPFLCGAFVTMLIVDPKSLSRPGWLDGLAGPFIVLTFALMTGTFRTAAGLRAHPAVRAADSLRMRLGLAVGLPAGLVLSPYRFTAHAHAAPPTDLQPAKLLALAGAGWLLGMWLEWVMASNAAAQLSAPRNPIWALLLSVTVISAMAQQLDSSALNAQSTPDSNGSVLDLLILPAAVLPATMLPLVMPVWAQRGNTSKGKQASSRIRRLTGDVWRQVGRASPAQYGVRPKHAPAFAALAALLAAPPAGVLAAAYWGGACDTSCATASTTSLAVLGGSLGAALGAATAAYVKTAPVLRAMLVGLGSGMLCPAVLRLAAPTTPWSWLDLVQQQIVLAAVLAALVVSALRYPARRTHRDAYADVPDQPPIQLIQPESITVPLIPVRTPRRPTTAPPGGEPEPGEHVGEHVPPPIGAVRHSAINPTPHASQQAHAERVTIAGMNMFAKAASDFLEGFAILFTVSSLFLLAMALVILFLSLIVGVVGASLGMVADFWSIPRGRLDVVLSGYPLVLLCLGAMGALGGTLKLAGGLWAPQTVTMDGEDLAITTRRFRMGSGYTLRIRWDAIQHVSVVGRTRHSELVVWCTPEAVAGTIGSKPFTDGVKIANLLVAFGWPERKKRTSELRAALAQFAGAKYVENPEVELAARKRSSQPGGGTPDPVPPATSCVADLDPSVSTSLVARWAVRARSGDPVARERMDDVIKGLFERHEHLGGQRQNCPLARSLAAIVNRDDSNGGLLDLEDQHESDLIAVILNSVVQQERGESV